MPSSLNLPIVLLSHAIGRSPWRTIISTSGWLSAAVLNTSLRSTGIVVFASIIGVNTSPIVAIPKEIGVTSSSKTSAAALPARTLACLAAPRATASSKSLLIKGLLKAFFKASCTEGIREEPPTSRIPSSSSNVRPDFSRARLAISTTRSVKSAVSASNFARVRVYSR